MKPRFIAIGLTTLIAFGCGSKGNLDSGGSGGTGVGGAFANGGNTPAPGGTSGVASLGPDGLSAACPEAGAMPPQTHSRVTVDLAVHLFGKPLVFGESNQLAPKGGLTPTNLRFYLSQFAFRAGNVTTPGTLITSQGVPVRYGVQFVNVEDPASLKFAVSVPPGSYDSVVFTLGLTHGCNDTLAPRKPPLDQASQMKWPHTLGFLFLRYEGKRSTDADAMVLEEIHMGTGTGDNRFAPRLTVPGPFVVEGTSLNIGVAFQLDEVLKAAIMETDLSAFVLPEPAPPGPIGDEILAGEKLRQHAKDVSIFRRLP